MPAVTRRHGLASRIVVAAALGAVVLLLLGAVSLTVGSGTTGWRETLATVLGHGSPTDAVVIGSVRVPRLLLATASGAALGAAGALVQALTRNPIADPGVLGITGGAALAVVLAGVLLGRTSPGSTLWASLLGSLVTTAAVLAIAAGPAARSDPARLLLAGVAISAVFGGVATVLVRLDVDLFGQMAAWSAGSTDRRGWEPLLVALPFVAIGIIVALLMAPVLDQLALGDELAAATGAGSAWIRVALVLAVAVLAGGATAMVGPISFVGLMVPHLARRVAGASQPGVVSLSIVLGAAVMLGADLVGRVVLPFGELPVGIVTGFVGAPMLVLVLVRWRRTRR